MRCRRAGERSCITPRLHYTRYDGILGEHEAAEMNKIGLDEKFALFSEYWRPKTIAALNGQEIKLVKVQGEFPWHHHEHEAEFFMVWRGRFRVEFRDHIVALEAGECVVVPRGVEHRTCADQEALILCFEPAGTINTGNVTGSSYTAEREAI